MSGEIEKGHFIPLLSCVLRRKSFSLSNFFDTKLLLLLGQSVSKIAVSERLLDFHNPDLVPRSILADNVFEDQTDVGCGKGRGGSDCEKQTG